jgi:peptidoglycan endopeptidase LytE
MRNHTMATTALGLLSALLFLSLPAHAVNTYTVAPGDSIWEIAVRLNVSHQSLLDANGLTEESAIHPEQQLIVPDAESEETQECDSSPRREHVYAVQRGDCLSRIARRFGVTVGELVDINSIKDPDLIQVASVLRIPVRGEEVSDRDDADSLVRTALTFRGVPYRWAGMSSRGMDCSGLVARVLGLHGIRAPHSAKALYKLGKPVAREDLQPGDLVFFHTTRPGISHVGIYMGDGKFIHASSRGGRVTVDRLDQGYYCQRLVGARRIG